jgi:lipoprotein-releasing system permease protein
MIARLFMWQGCLIALAGIGIGVVLGVIGALQISDLAAFVEASLGIQILNAEVYPIDFLPSQLRLSDVLIVTVGVLLLATLATLYPARRAAAIQPAEALRAD